MATSDNPYVDTLPTPTTTAPPPLPPRQTEPPPSHSTVQTQQKGESEAGESSGGIGDKARGLFGAIHGAGEVIRGTFNSTMDGLGDGIAGRQKGEVISRSGPSDEVTRNGLAEFNSGVTGLKG
ncbi:hypothetical protein T439DRAFT_330030 [Meredithblackwellia eburnea MCA 4105]